MLPHDTEFTGDVTTDDPLVATDVEALGAGGSALPLVPEPRRPGRRKRRAIAYWASVVWIVAVALAAIFADFLPLDDPNRSDFAAIAQPPSWDHLMGTDEVGRDILSRVVYGARVSLLVGIVSVLLGMFVGGLFGLSAGYIKGRVEAVIMTATDALLAFPALVLLLTLAAVFGQNLPEPGARPGDPDRADVHPPHAGQHARSRQPRVRRGGASLRVEVDCG